VTTTQPPGRRGLILGLLCLASFAVVFNNLIITPILPDISENLHVRVAIAGLLVTAYAVVGGIAAIFSGPIIDRIGRKPVVVTGMSLLTVATALSAIAPNFIFLAGSRMMAGLGVACLTPAVFAAVGDYFSYEERGRAMSWVISANTGASILGVPAGAFISGLLSWRWSFGLMAALSVIFVALLFLKLPKDSPRLGVESGGMRSVPRVLRNLPTSMAIFSNYVSTSYWFVFVTYMGAYFHDEFHVAKWALGVFTMVMGVGCPDRQQRRRTPVRQGREAADHPLDERHLRRVHLACDDALTPYARRRRPAAGVLDVQRGPLRERPGGPLGDDA
jgi:predicted MFS family arabinose efflux permease